MRLVMMLAAVPALVTGCTTVEEWPYPQVEHARATVDPTKLDALAQLDIALRMYGSTGDTWYAALGRVYLEDRWQNALDVEMAPSIVAVPASSVVDTKVVSRGVTNRELAPYCQSTVQLAVMIDVVREDVDAMDTAQLAVFCP